jgi:large subunit ribosomal protein L5
LGWKNVMQTPKIEKVVVSVGVGKMAKDKEKVELVADRLEKITGQKPVERGAKKLSRPTRPASATRWATR